MQNTDLYKTEIQSDLSENRLLFHSAGMVYLKTGNGNEMYFLVLC